MKIQRQFSGRTILTMTFAFCMAVICGFIATQNMKTTSAATTQGFNAGNIISDAVMGNYNSMTLSDIQRFLTSKNPCNNRDHNRYQQLERDNPKYDWHWKDGHFVCLSEERFGDGQQIGSGQTATEIIYQAAQDYKINPQVLLVVLQKETSLVTDPIPNNGDYRKAMGFACSDSAPCEAKYYGFKNQIRAAANLFHEVLSGGWSNYPVGKTVYVQYNPNKACGGSNVYIANKATSALYRYTPYQPNQSALNAGYGLGDGCGAYGNRNFYLYFNEWFGSTQAYVNGTQVTIPDGIYGLTSKINSKEILEVSGHSTQNGANVQIWDRNTSASQKMSFKRGSDGYYTITDVNSGKVIDLANGSTVNGTNIQLFESNGSCAQKWKAIRTPDNYLTFESACSPGMVLDVSGGKGANGTNIQLFLTNNTNSQKWSLFSGKVLEDGVYEFHSDLDNNTVVDLSNAGTHDGANIQTWKLDKHTFAQKWSIIYDPNGDYYTFSNPKSGKVLDISGGKFYSGSNIQLFTRNNSCAQRWKIVRYNNSSYTITSACQLGFAMDIFNGKKGNGVNLQLWDINNSAAQHWKLVPTQLVPDSTYTISSSLSHNKAIDVSNADTKEGTNIQLWDKNNTPAQKWQITYDGKRKQYTIINPKSGKPLYLAGNAKRSGENIHLGKNDTNCNKYWNIREDRAGNFIFVSSCNGKNVIDVSGGNVNSGTNIQSWESNNTAAQKWKFE